MVVLVTGPVRSGKGAFGVRLARESGLEVTYVATAAGSPEDIEWRARLTRHVRDRPASWRTVETAAMPHEAQLALFRDAMGRMVQRFAKQADRVYLVVAGHALDLRALGESIDRNGDG